MLIEVLFFLVPFVSSFQHHEIKTPLTVANPVSVVESVVERIQTQNFNKQVYHAVKKIRKTFRHPNKYLADANTTQCFKDLTTWKYDLGNGSNYALKGMMF